MRETSSRVVAGRAGMEGCGQRARFRVSEVSAGVRGRESLGRSRDASRRAIRRGGRRPDPSIAPIGMSAIERLKARVREPENADGGGSHASVYAGGLRVTHPRLCPCLCRSDLRRRPCRTRQPLSGPSSPPWSSPRRPSRASRPSARSPRKEGFALLLCSPNARRARGDGDDDADAFAREPGRFDAPASTGVRLPSAGTFTNAHRTRWRVRTTVRLGGADTRLSQTERGPLHFRPTLPHNSRESSKNAKRCSCRQVV
jgi:hypothetical protein